MNEQRYQGIEEKVERASEIGNLVELQSVGDDEACCLNSERDEKGDDEEIAVGQSQRT